MTQMQAQLEQMQAQSQAQLQHAQDRIEARLDELQLAASRLRMQVIRLYNYKAGLAEPLVPVPNELGAHHAGFPATPQNLAELTGDQCNALLAHYDVQPPAAANVHARRALEAQIIGCSRP